MEVVDASGEKPELVTAMVTSSAKEEIICGLARHSMKKKLKMTEP